METIIPQMMRMVMTQIRRSKREDLRMMSKAEIINVLFVIRPIFHILRFIPTWRISTLRVQMVNHWSALTQGGEEEDLRRMLRELDSLILTLQVMSSSKLLTSKVALLTLPRALRKSILRSTSKERNSSLRVCKVMNLKLSIPPRRGKRTRMLTKWKMIMMKRRKAKMAKMKK
jgi:hypothetical protein